MAFYEWKHEYHDNRGRFDFGMMSVDYSVGAHWHKAIELMYIVEGDVLVSVDEEKHVMKTGEIVICSSRQIHYFTSLCESSKMSFVIFDEDILDKLDEIAESCSAREGAAINAQTDRICDLLIGGN